MFNAKQSYTKKVLPLSKSPFFIRWKSCTSKYVTWFLVIRSSFSILNMSSWFEILCSTVLLPISRFLGQEFSVSWKSVNWNWESTNLKFINCMSCKIRKIRESGEEISFGICEFEVFKKNMKTWIYEIVNLEVTLYQTFGPLAINQLSTCLLQYTNWKIQVPNCIHP